MLLARTAKATRDGQAVGSHAQRGARWHPRPVTTTGWKRHVGARGPRPGPRCRPQGGVVSTGLSFLTLELNELPKGRRHVPPPKSTTPSVCVWNLRECSSSEVGERRGTQPKKARVWPVTWEGKQEGRLVELRGDCLQKEARCCQAGLRTWRRWPNCRW